VHRLAILRILKGQTTFKMKNMQPKHRGFLPVIAFLTLVLFSAFRRPDNHLSGPLQKQQLFCSINNPADTGGRSVNMDSAQACIDRFEQVMKEHGFSDAAGKKVNIRIRRTSMITTGEIFQGKALLDWLNSTAAQYDAAGKTLMIKIQLGIYDSAYLNTYQSDPVLRNKNIGRIGIFIVPYAAAPAVQQGVHANVTPPPPPPGGGGYDLGGIYP
jgi:hypothetical protein